MDAARLDEITELLKPLRNAWFDMPEEAKQKGHHLLREKSKLAEGA